MTTAVATSSPEDSNGSSNIENKNKKGSEEARQQVVLQEIQQATKKLPLIQIQSATSHFLTAVYERTPHRRVKLTLTFSEGYPYQRPLIVDIATDDHVPPGLKRKLENELGQVASTKRHGGMNVEDQDNFQQVESVLQRLQTFLDTNKFVSCWKELRQCVEMVHKLGKADHKAKGSTIQLNEVKGLIKLKLVHDKYFYSCNITINDSYPTTTTHQEWGKACDLRLTKTNFPPKIEHMLTTQAQELVRRMQDGMPAEKALTMSNPVKAPAGSDNDKPDKDSAPRVRLTQQAIKGLKKDMDTLAHVRDLRQVDSATQQGNATKKLHSAKERKDARRTVAKITNREREADAQAEAKWEEEERARMAGYDISPFDGSSPQPSLLSLLTFLIQKIQRLPEEKCPICKQTALLSDPTKLASLYQSASSNNNMTAAEKKARKLARKKRPMRVYCGCWYHHECLDTFMREPPFGAACPVHPTRRVYHPDWPADIRELERAYMSKEARRREIEDVANFI